MLQPKPLSTLFLFFAFPFAFVAQRSDTLKRAVEFQLTYGASANRQLDFSPATWNKLTPDYPNPDITDTAFHHARRYGASSGAAYAAVHVNLQLKLRVLEVRRLTPMLGFTIGSAQGARAATEWWKSASYRIDTLSSNQNGAQYYVDSIVQQNIRKEYVSNQYFIGSRFVLQTNRRKRISALFGIQLNVGISSYNRTEVGQSMQQYANAYPVSQAGYSQPLYHFPWNYQAATVNVRKSGWYYGFSIPMGMDVRLGKREGTLLSKMTVGIELALGGTWMQIPDVGIKSTPTFNFGFTYKYRFPQRALEHTAANIPH